MELKLSAIIYLSSRICSSLLGIVIFAKINKKLDTPSSEQIFYLIFTIGFLVAFLRSYCLLNANLNGNLRRADRLHRIYECAQGYKSLAPWVLALFILIYYFQCLTWWSGIVLAFITYAAGYDSDLTRAVIKKQPIYSWLFLVGNAITLFFLYSIPNISFEAIIFAVISGWVPIAIYNVIGWCKDHNLRKNKLYLTKLSLKTKSSMRSVLVSSLEGIVVNFPFLGGSYLNSNGYDLAIAMRIFSSSQPLFPYISHLTNSGKLQALSEKYGISESLFYWFLLVFSGVLVSLLFVIIFDWVGGGGVTWIQYLIFLMLLFSYTFCNCQMRFNSMSIDKRKILILCFSCFMCIALLILLSTLHPFQSLVWAFSQTLLLTISGVVIFCLKKI